MYVVLHEQGRRLTAVSLGRIRRVGDFLAEIDAKKRPARSSRSLTLSIIIAQRSSRSFDHAPSLADENPTLPLD